MVVPTQEKYICEDPHRFLDAFGEQRVASALEVVGTTFLQHPFDLRHPEAIYDRHDVLRSGLPEAHNTLRLGNVELVGQGPLPIEFDRQTYMCQMAAFAIEGLPQAHSAFVLTYGELGKDQSRRVMRACYEDRVSLVMQHGSGGSLWHDMDRNLGRIFTDGGAFTLLPECARNFSQEHTHATVQNIASMIGIPHVQVLSPPEHHVYESPFELQLIDKFCDESALSKAKITKREFVHLPWSPRPFFHIEVQDHKRPGDIHHVWAYGPVLGMSNVPFRPHSACSSSEVLGAINCDCPDQLDATMNEIVQRGYGVLMYLDQEARGHGLPTKVQTWGMNIEHMVDLIAAFHAAGFKEDVREFDIVAEILKYLRIGSIQLLSNNKQVKQHGLIEAGVVVEGRLPVSTPPRSVWCANDHHAKKEKRGDDFGPASPNAGNRVMVPVMKLKRH